MIKKFLNAAVLGLAATVAVAQSPCYDTNYGTAIGSGDDTVLPIQSIGFSFPFAGASYSDIHVSTNGFFYLSNAGVPTPGGALCCAGTSATLLANTAGPMICPFWTDLNVVAANNAQVFVNASATVCTITWNNVIEYADPANTLFNLQAKIYPSGQIDFTYSTNVAMRTAGDCLVGVSPGNGATDPGSSDLSVGGAATTNSMYEIFNNTALPSDLAGSMVTLLPTNPGYVYVTTPCTSAVPPAFNTSYGQGCVRSFNSFYENYATAGAFDLDGTSMTLLNTGNGYLALAGTATYFAPTANATSLALVDDSEATVTLATPFPVNGGSTNSLTVCSNGYVSVATGNGTAWTPNVAAFLAMPQTVFACWHDYNPTIAGSGTVKFEQAGGIAYVTWDGVYSHTTTLPDTWQLQFDTATGTVNFVWVSSSFVGNGKLVGYSPAGASQDPGSLDLSVMLPGTISVSSGVELIPLGLTAAGTAAPGSTVTLSTTNTPAGSPFGALAFGLTQFAAGLPLGGLGMPGCYQYNEAAAVQLYFAPNAGGSYTAPTGTAFLGVKIQVQAAVYAPGATPLGFITSNGIEMTLGT